MLSDTYLADNVMYIIFVCLVVCILLAKLWMISSQTLLYVAVVFSWRWTQATTTRQIDTVWSSGSYIPSEQNFLVVSLLPACSENTQLLLDSANTIERSWRLNMICVNQAYTPLTVFGICWTSYIAAMNKYLGTYWLCKYCTQLCANVQCYVLPPCRSMIFSLIEP